MMKEINVMNNYHITLCTHNGIFHADDVLAYSILKNIFPNSTLIRTRDASIIKKSNIVFDVGMEYDPYQHRYDHHMRNKPLRDNGIPYSSAGLVWKFFGKDYIKKNFSISNDELNKVFDDVDNKFIINIDKHDNGIQTNSYNSILISKFNANWSDFTDNDEENEILNYNNFLKASDFFTIILNNEIKNSISYLSLEELVLKHHKTTNEKYLVNLENYDNLPDIKNICIKYNLEVIASINYSTTKKYWKLYCMSKPNEKFSLIVSLPDEWGGLENSELQKVSGINDLKFCHSGLFFCIAETYESIMKVYKILEEKYELIKNNININDIDQT